MDVIRTDNLTKYYGPHVGAEGLDLSVRQGEVFGYLGPNGAGKTTTIRLLLDLIRPTAGSASVLGMDSRRDSRRIRRRVGYLPGELTLYEHMTGRQMLTHLAGLQGEAPALADELAERLACDLDRPVGDLSRGNKQKVGLIQAFMHEPDLLILDEPTSGLDPLMRRTFYRMVEEAREDGRTVFLSSHVLSEVERICDRVGIIRQGQLVAVETVAALKQRALRRLEIRFGEPVDPGSFRRIGNIQDLTVDGKHLRCTVQGPLDAVVKAAAAYEIVDITTEQVDLEEIFLAYYDQDYDRDSASDGEERGPAPGDDSEGGSDDESSRVDEDSGAGPAAAHRGERDA